MDGNTTKITSETSSEVYNDKPISSNHSSGNANISGNAFVVQMKRMLGAMGRLGKTLQFPIAVLPFAALLNRFGALGIAFTTDSAGNVTNAAGHWISWIIQQPGAVVFAQLPVFFAIGCGFGLAKDKRGEAALATLVFYFVSNILVSEHGLPELFYGHLGVNGTEHSSAFWFSYSDSKGTHWLSKLYYGPTYDGKNINGGKYILNTGVLSGIVAGCLTAYLYNRFRKIRLPEALAFFGGRRFVPMLAIVAAVPVGFIYAAIWPWVQLGLTAFGSFAIGTISGADHSVLLAGKNTWNGASVASAGIYGFINRLLMPFGMHQILNVFLWFQAPITGVQVMPGTGALHGGVQTVNGDVSAFTKGIWGSGIFQGGYFPMFLGGEPAIVAAMIMTSKKENRKTVATFLGGTALVTFLTGVDEPIVFQFVFLSPVLLVVYALYTSIFCMAVIAMHIHLGFGFSAGFMDYAISLPQSWGFSHHEGVLNSTYGVLSNPLWILPLALICGIMFYFTFYFLIKKMDIPTPGRGDADLATGGSIGLETDNGGTMGTEDDHKAGKKHHKKANKADKYQMQADKIIEGIGKDNFVTVDNCATRLRITVKDSALINQDLIKSAGVFGINILSKKDVQIIIGVDVENVTDIINETLRL